MTTIGKNIRKYRRAKDLTLQKLADEIGSAKAYIWKLENRTPKNPSKDKLRLIAEALCVPLEKLYEEKTKLKVGDDETYISKFLGLEDYEKTKVKQIIDLFAADIQ